MKYYLPIQTKIGLFYAISEQGKIIQLGIPEEISDLDKMLPGEQIPVLQDFKAWINAYNRGSVLPPQNIPINPQGTVFQRSVWKMLTEISFGCYETYGNLAQKMAKSMEIKKMSPQAVGAAVGKNPIPFLIPCHRVLGARGSLTGFRYGIQKKTILLDHESIPHKK